jgi:hypothetical protein
MDGIVTRRAQQVHQLPWQLRIDEKIHPATAWSRFT